MIPMVDLKGQYQTLKEEIEQGFQETLQNTSFILGPNVKRRVTVVSSTKIPVKEVFSFFQSVLEVHGYTTVEAGSVVKIVPSATARGKSVETRVTEELEPQKTSM